MPKLQQTDGINFGDLPPAINAILQDGVSLYPTDRAGAERLFREALDRAPEELPTYYCLYKIHTYQGSLEEARIAAEAGLAEATRQIGWPGDWRAWPKPEAPPQGAARFALYTLKALAFIHLRREEVPEARAMLDVLRGLDPEGLVGWPIIASLAEEME
ncbi:tetratricopeptide repeat protein [Rhodospirillum sp. A1_3_36]|uniref:tetratricopeptide repeat protein n=1 Tax=Rhodospirillum sp. A1_3_36 TaxID=3391666 RepID=UPI0039A701C9